MISSQLAQYIPTLDKITDESDADFEASGLKQTSIIRLARLAVVSQSTFLGCAGEVAGNRLTGIKQKLVA